jgi:hypothetical protein
MENVSSYGSKYTKKDPSLYFSGKAHYGKGNGKAVPALLTKPHAAKAYGGVELQLHVFLTSALGGSEWSTSHPGERTPDTHWIGAWKALLKLRSSLRLRDPVPIRLRP